MTDEQHRAETARPAGRPASRGAPGDPDAVKPATGDTGSWAAAGPHTIVLGVAQDAGYPQAGCRGACCEPAWRDPSARRHAACLAIVDPATGQRWLIDATPDLREQLRALDDAAPPRRASPDLDGILLTHAHIGHYAGLIHLGREAMDAAGTPVYAMPRMRAFLSHNAPWSDIVASGNIELRALEANRPHQLSADASITALLVPHRDEASETVAFRIDGRDRSVLYVPDIDDWDAWEKPLEDAIREVDIAYLDGTFYDEGELPGRDMRNVPHPLMRHTMDRLRDLPAALRARVRFLHLNHTNPAMIPGSAAARSVTDRGLFVADEGERFNLHRRPGE